MRTWTAFVTLTVAATTLATGSQRNENSRIAIKRATDDAATHIPGRAQKTTVEDMLNQTRPDGLAPDISSPEYQNKRIDKFETTKWQVQAVITQVIKRPDGDFYCVIEGKSGAKTVFEAPDPELCAGSHFLKEIKRVRKILDDKFHPTGQPVAVHINVTLTGIGFFGYQGKNAAGDKTNGARLMPLLDVKIAK
jgi:hypothetical protein